MMMEKEKYCLEYVFDKASKINLWNHLATPTGLSEWFADDVSIRGDNYIFMWNKSTEEAEKIAFSQPNFIRFKWLEEDDPNVFFEFRLHDNELTGGIMLEITDFTKADEKEESAVLWDSQVKKLKRSLGI